MSSDSNNDGLSESEIIKLLFKNYMNFTTTSHNKLFYEETQLSNNNNIFSSGVLTNSPPVDTPNFTDNVVQTASELSQYLSYAALPNINIDEDWFNSKRTIGLTDSSGVFSVDSTDDTERTVLRLETIKLDYLGGTSAAFVCNDNSGVNILQNLVPPNYATNGYSTRLWYLNNNNILAEIGWLASRSTLGTGTYVGHDVSFGGALFDSKNGVITFYDVLNDDPAAVFSEVSCNFYLTATKYIGSTLADGGVGSGPVNPAGQTFHEVVTGAPQTFTMGDISSTLFTIDISWDFADIQPTESNNRLFNFPLPNKRDRVIPYMSHIYFDISSSTDDIIDFSANIEIDSSHNYAEDSKEVSGNIPSTGGDLSYNLTYRTLTLTKFSEDTRTYTVNVWGVNESNESSLYKLPFVDISFVPDSEAVPTTIDYSMNAYDSLDSEDLSLHISDSDGNIVRFKIVDGGSFGSFAWKNPLGTNSDGVSDETSFSSDGKWTFTPDNTSGNTTIEIKTWTDFYTKVDGQGISAEFYNDSDVSGFTSTINIHIFVDTEANFNPTPYTSDTSGISQDGKVVSGIVYATDTDGPIEFSISGGVEYPSDSGLWQYHTGDGSANIVAFSDVSAAWEYTPDSDFSGNDTFFIRTTDTSGGFTDISINIFVDCEAVFSGDIDVIGGNGEEISGNLGDSDRDGGVVKYEVISDPSRGEAKFYNDTSGTWLYTSDSGYTGYDSFDIRTSDASGGTTDISVNVLVPSFLTFQTSAEIDSNMKATHSNLIGKSDISSETFIFGDNTTNHSGYNWVVYRVHESGTYTNEYLPSDKSNTGTAGINLSFIMSKYFGDLSENSFYNSLYNTASNDILVYIVARRKLTGDYYMARISNLSQGPGFDEMNPWYWNNKVTESSLSSLTSGSGSGALPNENLQSEIRNNINDSNYENDFTTTYNGHDPIVIYTHSNILHNHHFYFAFKI